MCLREKLITIVKVVFKKEFVFCSLFDMNEQTLAKKGNKLEAAPKSIFKGVFYTVFKTCYFF